MSRRWKFVIALVVVGLTGFLAWAFLSDPNRGVAIRFLGYETNRFGRREPVGSIPTNALARFCFTNGSHRAISYYALDRSPMFLAETKARGGAWLEFPRTVVYAAYTRFVVLQPTQSTNFSVFVPDVSQPLRVTVAFSTNVNPEAFFIGREPIGSALLTPAKSGTNSFFSTFQSRVLSWLRVDQGEPSASITIQEQRE